MEKVCLLIVMGNNDCMGHRYIIPIENKSIIEKLAEYENDTGPLWLFIDDSDGHIINLKKFEIDAKYDFSQVHIVRLMTMSN